MLPKTTWLFFLFENSYNPLVGEHFYLFFYIYLYLLLCIYYYYLLLVIQ